MATKTNYNEIASTYDESYKVNYLKAVEQLLFHVASEDNVHKILEADCVQEDCLNHFKTKQKIIRSRLLNLNV